MRLRLQIDGEPTRAFVRHDGDATFVDLRIPHHALLRAISPLRSSAGENANLSVELDNRGGEVSAYYTQRPPIGSTATLWRDDSVLVFTGVVQSLSLDSSTARIEVEA